MCPPVRSASSTASCAGTAIALVAEAAARTAARTRPADWAPRSANTIAEATAMSPASSGTNPPPIPAQSTNSTGSRASSAEVTAAAAAGPTPATSTARPGQASAIAACSAATAVTTSSPLISAAVPTTTEDRRAGEEHCVSVGSAARGAALARGARQGLPRRRPLRPRSRRQQRRPWCRWRAARPRSRRPAPRPTAGTSPTARTRSSAASRRTSRWMSRVQRDLGQRVGDGADEHAADRHRDVERQRDDHARDRGGEHADAG